MQYPPQLMYNNINPKGFFSTFKQWTIQPIANGGNYWAGQNIKILIQSVITGVMDPYRSHFEIQVQCDQQTLPVGLLQVDSSAQSFIEQLVISSRNRQLQRIPQYGVLAAWLTDIGLTQMYAEGRQTEGLGYTNVESLSTFSTPNFGATSNSASISNRTLWAGSSSLGTVNPTISPVFNTHKFTGAVGTNSQTIPYTDVTMNSNNHIQSLNPSWMRSINQIVPWRTIQAKNTVSQCSIKQYGRAKNVRAQYKSSLHSSKYTDSTNSRPSYQINIDPKVYEDGPDSLWETGLTYKTVIPSNIRYTLQNPVSTTAVQKTIPNITSLNGYTSLYSPNFCKGVNQPFISPTVPQCQMQNGLILPTKIPIRKKTFKIPLISAIIGLLIPQDQFILLPIKALNQVLIQIVLDKFAMFTSGYNDISQFDQLGITKIQGRNFTVRRFDYHLHTYQFYSPQIDQYLNRAIMNRIVLNVNMWTLGNQYVVARGDNVNNSWPVACTSQALNQIVVLFVPHDYLHYTFCRKHFRISNNITKFQLRINMDYYPSQPITGNGGNPQLIQNLDNSNYIQSIYWSNNFMFNKVNPFPRLNPYNFAINQRCYDIKNTNTFYNKSMINDINYNWDANSINSDTAMGMPFIHQNRFVGKAGYTFSFEPYAHSAYHMTGIDCRQVRQFDVLLTTQPANTFPRQLTIFIYTRSSVIVEFSNNGINVYGK